ncbi:CusA/CzcA family heavy metal efflux RND transporter [Flavihumibacter sp. CACIAM 22H1]|uniref:efflux RND transporter permease subunit n=1 Tax=Flavihumibacter sp. CACIAM 22H1 TaxID=1812911 RepID=UPI0007A8CEB7|nr:CusA/CzcA family heavy metal efflux RND transporter [Flavihumibacter sp. CACIAM 22H1]KYP15974.1 MAG: cation transporter [Flavihumibacter sp. CACIAM 22H1]
MNKLIRSIIGFSLKNRLLIIALSGILAIAGYMGYSRMPLEAFPDVTNTQIIVVTQWNGRSAEEVERLVTTPIEVAMNAVQRKSDVRSVTMFGLSVIKIIFEDDVEDFFARQQVNNLLGNVELPDGVAPDVQPPYGPTGEIFRYLLTSEKRDSRELLSLQNWVVDRQLRAVPGVADIVAFGGQEKVYEIALNPVKLQSYGISANDVYKAVQESNLNVGGDIMQKNQQAFVVRGLGLLHSIQDIENTIVTNMNGNPVLVKMLATVRLSSAPRVGQVGYNTKNDVVEGIVVMRKGENPSVVLGKVKEKIAFINAQVLPSDVQIQTFYDRDNLIDYCKQTVLNNLVEGIVLVTVVVFLFMADWRTTLTVSLVIPLSLLFAFLCLYWRGMSANLLSLGAIDFGIIIDGAVVMTEGIFVALDQLAHRTGMERFNKLAKLGLIRKRGTEMGKAVFFSKLIIITALLPIFAFQKVEGKMFSPLAFTLGFALLGALLFSLTLVPVLCSFLLRKNVREKNNPIVHFFNKLVVKGFDTAFAWKKTTVLAALLVLAVSVYSFKWMGTEFLPQLNEGALWVTAEMPMSISLEESLTVTEALRMEMKAQPEVKQVLSQAGRSNDGTDPNGFYFVQFQVDLKPLKEWPQKQSVEAFIARLNQQLLKWPGITYNYSQPIVDNVAEAVAGFKASNGVKIYGTDLAVLEQYAIKITGQLAGVKGVEDLGIIRNIGQPEISVLLDEEKMAIYGVTKADALSVIEMAIGGKTATQKYEGEQRYAVRIRYDTAFRRSESDIRQLRIPASNGVMLPLGEIAAVSTITGPAFIYRENNLRFIGIKFSVRDRDLGSTLAEARAKVAAAVQLPEGYRMAWVGEYENQVRASETLAKLAPLSLLLIFGWLFILFGNIRDAGLVLTNVPFALIGGILALHITDTNFGISAGVGFIALFGICVQNGVLLISAISQFLRSGDAVQAAVRKAVIERTRPIVMTALMASLGLLPAALSNGIGSESQKPLAIVIIGGLITATVLTLLVFPVIYWMVKRER